MNKAIKVLCCVFLSFYGVAGAAEFGGMTFGTGISVAFNGKTKSTTAELDPNGIVRVTEENSAVARIVLESHYLFTCDDATKDKDNWCYDNRLAASGHGPFVAFQPGDKEVIQAIGFGWMLAFRHTKAETKSWNIGLGVMVDPKVQVLGDGITANQALPGETQVRYKNTARYSWS